MAERAHAYFARSTMAIPQGLPGDLMRLISFWVARSTTETSSDGPLAAKRRRPSGEIAIPQGRVPTLIDSRTAPLAASTTQWNQPRPALT